MDSEKRDYFESFDPNDEPYRELRYGDRIIRMEGVIVDVSDGGISVDLKGRLGHIEVPLRMVISDGPLEVGQEIGWNMSFLEQLDVRPNAVYVRNRELSRKFREKKTAEKQNRDRKEQ
jgi:hypothetical protein